MCINAQMMDWDDLKYILAVSRNGGLSGAARALSVNHSTVSRRIAIAEERLGVRLFDRLPSGLTATSEGEKAIEVARETEARVGRLELEIASGDRKLSGKLRVTAPVVLIQTYFAKVFARFIELYPDIELTVIASNDALNLHQREADVAIRISDSPDESLFGRRVINMRRAYYCSSEYLNEKFDASGELKPGCSPDYINFIWWGKGVPKEIIDIYPSSRVAVYFDDMVALYSSVREGSGISLMPCIIGEGDKLLERVSTLPFAPYRDVWVLTHPDLKKVERVRVFMKFICEALEEDKRFFTGGAG
ncbi:MAG: LysR family transcriptional regulator [Methyloligellaceae bacterium]